MMNFKKILFILLLGIALPFLSYAIDIGGTEYNNLRGWAWSDNVGWVGFSCHTSEAEEAGIVGGEVAVCGNSWGSHVVMPAESAAAGFDSNAVIGHAWSTNIGWISFQRSETGAPPTTGISGFDSRFAGASHIAELDTTTNRILGWARVLGACTGVPCTTLVNPDWDGWIYFGDIPGGVTIDAGGAWTGYAWGGDVIGWMVFDNSRTAYTGPPVGPVVSGSAPVASMVATPNISDAGGGSFSYNVDTDGSASYDPDTGDTITYIWQWGDGSTATGVSASHTYVSGGDYTISLTVTDSVGLSSTVTRTVSFFAPDTSACLISCASDAECNAGAGNVCFIPVGAVTGFCIVSPTVGGPSGDTPIDVSSLDPYACTPSERNTRVLSSCEPTTGSTNFLCGNDTVLGPFCVGPELGVCPSNGICADTGITCSVGERECAGDLRVYSCIEDTGSLIGRIGGYSTSGLLPEPSMPVGLLPEGEACTKPTADAPNNCEGINGCLYYNFSNSGERYGSACIDNANCPSGAICSAGACVGATTGFGGNDSVANCISTSVESQIEPTGCVYYANGLVNCLPSSSFSGLPSDCRVIERGNSVVVDCRNIDAGAAGAGSGRGCIFRSNGEIDCTFENAVGQPYAGCIYEPNPQAGVICPGIQVETPAIDRYIDCAISNRSAGSVIGAGGPCSSSGTCPGSAVCLGGTCMDVCDTSVAGSCDIGLTCTSPCPPGELWDSTVGACVPSIWFTFPECSGTFLREVGATATTTTSYSPPLGTTQINIGLTTDEDSECRYSTDPYDVFGSMAAFGITGSLIHETLVSGLFPMPDVNRYLVRCQNTTTSVEAPACRIFVRIGADAGPGGGGSCTTDADCWGGVCLTTGYCGYPSCSGAYPYGTLPAGTTGTTIGMTTETPPPAIPSSCRYDTNISTDFFTMPNTLITDDGGLNHYAGVTGLVDGYNAYYVQCQDLAPSLISGDQELSAKCGISFRVGGSGGSCTPGTICPSGAICPVSGICPGGGGGGGSCTPGTICPNGTICPVNGVCDPTPCTSDLDCIDGWLCNPATNTCVPPCPSGTVYNPLSGLCEGGTACPVGTAWDPFTATCVSEIPTPTPFAPTECNVLGITFVGTAPGSGIGPSENCSIVAVLLALLQWFAWIIAVIAVIYGLRGGYLYITSGGDQAKLDESKKAIIYTMVGVIVAISSFGIVAIARAIIGI